MMDQINSQRLRLPVCPVCPVCFAKMGVRGIFPIIYPSGRGDINCTFSCDRCRIQSSRILSVADVEGLSLLQRTREHSPNTYPRKLKPAFG